MRVALIGPVYPYRGGIAHYTTMLYRTLRERGHQVLMVSFRYQYPRWLFPGQSDVDPSEQPFRVEDAQYWLNSLNPLSWIWTFNRIRRYRPDVWVMQWWTTFWTPVWLTMTLLNAMAKGGPVLFICHNVFPHESRRLDHALARLVLQRGDAFIVQSDAEKEKLEQLLVFPRIRVIPHPMYDFFGKKLPKAKARRLLGLPETAVVLLFFGIIREYKGLKDALRALSRVHKHRGHVILIIAGEFWSDKGEYMKLIAELGLEDIVIIDDRYIPNEEVRLYFSAADALLAPYRTQTGSGVKSIARAYHVPVIESIEEIQDYLAGSAQVIRHHLDDSARRKRSDSGWEQIVRFIEECGENHVAIDSES